MTLKKDFLAVVIVCDNAPGTFQQAIAIRSVLEAFRVQVNFYQYYEANYREICAKYLKRCFEESQRLN